MVSAHFLLIKYYMLQSIFISIVPMQNYLKSFKSSFQIFLELVTSYFLYTTSVFFSILIEGDDIAPQD